MDGRWTIKAVRRRRLNNGVGKEGFHAGIVVVRSGKGLRVGGKRTTLTLCSASSPWIYGDGVLSLEKEGWSGRPISLDSRSSMLSSLTVEDFSDAGAADHSYRRIVEVRPPEKTYLQTKLAS